MKVRRDEKCAGLTKGRRDVDNTRSKAGRVRAVSVLQSATSRTQNVTIFVGVVGICGHDAVKEVVFADLFEQCINKDVDLHSRDQSY